MHHLATKAKKEHKLTCFGYCTLWLACCSTHCCQSHNGLKSFQKGNSWFRTYYRGSSPYGNFYTANFITEIFLNIPKMEKKNIDEMISQKELQAFLDFCGFHFRSFWFTVVYNSILFSSPLVLLSNLYLRGFSFRVFFCVSTLTALIEECL